MAHSPLRSPERCNERAKFESLFSAGETHPASGSAADFGPAREERRRLFSIPSVQVLCFHLHSSGFPLSSVHSCVGTRIRYPRSIGSSELRLTKLGRANERVDQGLIGVAPGDQFRMPLDPKAEFGAAMIFGHLNRFGHSVR